MASGNATAAQREQVHDLLSELVERAGFEPLVLAPIVEPDDRFFPDAWSGRTADVVVLVRRMMRYADLDDGPVAVEVELESSSGPAAWFDGVRDGTLHFGVLGKALRHPARIVPGVARAVAEAWRERKGLRHQDAGSEQRRVDLTTIYLGFGLLTTNARVQYLSSATAGLRSSVARIELGVVPPQLLEYALGLQHAVREDDAGLRRRLRQLRPDPASFVRGAYRDLRKTSTPEALRKRLGIPPPSTWPPPRPLAYFVQPLSGSTSDETATPIDDPAVEDRGVLGKNAGRPVFRVVRSKAMRLGRAFGLTAVLLGVLLTRMPVGLDGAMWKFGAAGVVLGAVGLLVGRFMEDSRCSEPQCATPLTANATTCPRCGGSVVGVIGHPKERLEAEERWTRLNADVSDDSPARTPRPTPETGAGTAQVDPP